MLAADCLAAFAGHADPMVTDDEQRLRAMTGAHLANEALQLLRIIAGVK